MASSCLPTPSRPCWTPWAKTQGCVREPKPPDLQVARSASGAVASSLEEWKKNNKVARLWQKDASLWRGTDESNWLRWRTLTEQRLRPPELFHTTSPDG